jgi:NAD(P)H-hydrate epimerase
LKKVLGVIAILDCISVENMRLSDAMTIEKYVPSLELMRRAAEGVFRAAQWHGKVAIVVGSGNNGGDGFALACILCWENIECAIFTVSQRLSADSAFYAARAEELGVTILPFTTGCLDGFDMVVDCLLGTGFQGGLRENYRIAIEAINASGAEVISVDINSGMHGDTGEGELIVRSDLTVTTGFVQHGLVAENAGRYVKRLVCADIGIRLAQEEKKICDDTEHHPNAIPCPPWLDMKIIYCCCLEEKNK